MLDLQAQRIKQATTQFLLSEISDIRGTIAVSIRFENRGRPILYVAEIMVKVAYLKAFAGKKVSPVKDSNNLADVLFCNYAKNKQSSGFRFKLNNAKLKISHMKFCL